MFRLEGATPGAITGRAVNKMSITNQAGICKPGVNRSDDEVVDAVKRILLSDQPVADKCLAINTLLPASPAEPPVFTAAQALRSLQWAVWQKTGGLCSYCDVSLNPFDRNAVNGFHIDHSNPRAKGGTDDLVNLVPACSRCNFAKYARTPEEWEAAKCLS